MPAFTSQYCFREVLVIMSHKVAPKVSAIERKCDQFHFYTCPIRIVGTVLGIWPLCLKDARFSFSPLLFIYGTVLITLTTIYRIYIEAPARPGFIFEVMRLRNLLLPVSFILSTVVLSLKLKKFLRCLNGMWSLRRFLTLSQQKLTFCVQIIFIVIGVTSHCGLVVSFSFVRPDAVTGLWVQMFSLDVYMALCLYMLKLEFFSFLFFLKNILINIRNDVEALETFDPSYTISALSIKVTHLTDLYENVMNLSECITDCFGPGLAVVTLLTFCNCFSTGYFFFVIRGYGIDWFLIGWMLLDLFQVWLVLTATELFIKEPSLLAIAVHKTLRAASDHHLIKQLKQFSMYLLHRKPIFTLCGLVPLDYSLFFTIAGSVTTYIIVLIQFQRTEGKDTYTISDFA